MPQAAGQRNPDPLTGQAGMAEKPAMAEKASGSDPRKARLAKALKANIARRKEQAKTRAAEPEAPDRPPAEGDCRN
ncbi:MAG: hypothetical protein ACKOED_01885 [Aestuariivirga sp.]|jgi:hypothetical protein|uniref:hypothetical protein n=1 Tax=Aestuariivirga sp. TaxID=2650926 RepID=UPI0038CF9ACE